METNKFAKPALILGIGGVIAPVSMICYMVNKWTFSFSTESDLLVTVFVGLISLAAVVLGFVFVTMAMGECKQESNTGGKGLAVGGFVCGIVGVVALAVMVAIGIFKT